eukprot:797883-Prorocentrum_minimum.AAC.1
MPPLLARLVRVDRICAEQVRLRVPGGGNGRRPQTQGAQVQPRRARRGLHLRPPPRCAPPPYAWCSPPSHV